ncbi:D-fructose 1,6-bisphosphatase [Acidianus sulfidivorans JP7]|uniref:D-fructose 1,6-bisphosphatase n=1 Tax=Acidianus sulfidivorans JP7 TaxID=619593 RepID=A0A2U9IKR8_9CREN|nr:inositol monophosphatase family protein [Acidianus sulfidivorans]AWR96629.1 D-fructose 1,6-bisphosphatase [Acidianus sulfidivorans JP7]
MLDFLNKVGEEATKYLLELHDKKGIDEIIGYHQGDTTRRVDKLSEEYIFDMLNHSDYSFSFISEESGAIIKENSDFIAVIDPLDGSTNYIYGIPWSSVSIAVFKKKEKNTYEQYAGVVAEVFHKNIYSYDESSSYINKKKIEKKTPLNKIVLPYYNKNQLELVGKIFSALTNFKIRNLGSSSLDMILVCTGRAYLFFDIREKLRNVDIAASSSFCEKLGIKAVDLKGNKINISLKEVNVVPQVIVTSDEKFLKSIIN